MRPSLGLKNLVRRLKQVVLPAPFGPIMAWIVPRRTLRFTPLTARKPANSLESPSVSRMNSSRIPTLSMRHCQRAGSKVQTPKRRMRRYKPATARSRQGRSIGRAIAFSDTAGAISTLSRVRDDSMFSAASGSFSFVVALADENATRRLAQEIAGFIEPCDLITLSGDLGAGKTTFARALIRHLAGDEALEVPSPTFTLTQAYELPHFPLLHVDLFRVGDPAEIVELGLADIE